MDLYTYYLYNNKMKFDFDNFRLDLQARGDIISNDSECENDDYVKNTLIATHQQATNFNNEHDQETNSNEDIFLKQQKLKEEANVAFVLGAKMARMQVEIERQTLEKKRSSLYDIIGINANINKPLSIEILEEMNVGQLQVLVNDLYCQIEASNGELINLLIERDSLSMEQDSILVDIEDLTRRLQERAIEQSKQPTECVYIIKRSERNIPKKSIFQNLFRKAMFI